MEIDGFSDFVRDYTGFNLSVWNGDEIQRLDPRAFPKYGHFILANARVPDEGRLEIDGGFDQRRGAFVEGKLILTWTDKEDKNTPSDQNIIPNDPPDSRDRNMEREVDKDDRDRALGRM